MELVTLSDGRTEFITTLDSAYQTIDEYLGADMARCIENMHKEEIAELQDEMSCMYTEDKASEIFGEPKTQALFSARNALDEIIEYLDNAKRIKREKLYDKLSNLRKEIDNEL